MASTLTCGVSFGLFRILLPLILLASWVIRYNAFSLIYLLFLIASPLLSIPDLRSMAGSTGHYLKALMTISGLITLLHVVFQFTLLGLGPESELVHQMTDCNGTEESILRQIGLQRMSNDYDPVDIALGVAFKIVPDIIVLLISVLTFFICRALINRQQLAETQLPSDAPKTPPESQCGKFSCMSSASCSCCDFLLVLFIALAAIIVPSAISSVYFVAFLIIMTCWAFKVKGGTCFQYVKVVLLVYAISHLVVLYLYQFQFFQDAVPHLDFAARLTGLTGINRNECNTYVPLQNYDGDVPWPMYVNPGILVCLIWILACQIRYWCCGQDSYTLLEDGTGKTKKRRQQSDPEKQVLAEDEGHPANESLVASGDAATNYNTIEQDGGAAAAAADGDKDPDAIDSAKPETDEQVQQKKSAFNTIAEYLMKQSFLLALIAMMAWSITFISWLTFVLLLLACIIWITPKSRAICYMASPFLVFYAECLLIGQFIYGFDLSELPEETMGYKIDEIGFKKFQWPCLQLGLQIIFTSMLWLTLRQFMVQRSPCCQQDALPLEPIGEGSQASIHSLSPTFGVVFSHYTWKLLVKYWIFVCCGMTLLISIQDVVIYRLIYMAFLLYFIIIFQVWNWFWRKTMYMFWWVVIVYSMGVLVILYTYQFEVFRDYWSDGTGWSADTLADIGLEKFDNAELFVKLLTPTSFIIVVIIQVHYFHTDFLRLSDVHRYRKELPPTDDTMDDTQRPSDDEATPDAPDGTTKDKDTTDKPHNSFRQLMLLLRKLVERASYYWRHVSQFLWCILEIHILKLVVFTIVIICCAEVSAVSAIYVLLIGILLPIWKLHPLLSHLAQFWTAIVLLAKMAYQLRMVVTDQWKSNCTEENSTEYMPAPFNETIDNAKWVGLVKVDYIAGYIQNYIGIMLILVFEAIIKLHENQKYSDPQKERPQHGITFPETTRSEADAGIWSCTKYFINYLFYKFGLEMCYVMFAITICVRVDAVALLYAIMLGILLLLSRRGNAYVWPVYVILLAILLPLQYFGVVGFPLGFCIQYPWVDNITQNLESWLFLPDYMYPPNAYKLLADLFLLLAICLQARVFLTEMGSNMETYGGGDNKGILPEVEANAENPVPDFTEKSRSNLDGIKYFVFCYMFWVTMAILFVTGTSRINLFSMGYMIASFCFMWYGQEYMLKPLRRIVRMWNGLIGYCFIVLLAKAALQLVGCVYIQTLFDNCCWLVQLLGITCLTPGASYAQTTRSATCDVESDNTGLSWDVVCFTFLLLQRRIYTSHYFRHVVTDLMAQKALASRGAILINRILIRRSQKLQEDEAIVLEGIKSKMKMIKDRQARAKKGYVESEDHFQVIRSGDYYMFEDVDEDVIPEEEADPNTITLGMKDDDDPDPTIKLLSTAIESGTKKAVDTHESPDEDSFATAPPATQSAMTTPGSDDDKTILDKDKPDAEEEPTPTIYDKISNIVKLTVAILLSLVDKLIDIFNDVSRNYRYVAHKLQNDKEQEKAKIKAEQKRVVASDEGEGAAAGTSADADKDDLIEVKVETVEPVPSTSTALVRCASVASIDNFDDRTGKEQKSHIYRLVEATYFLLISRSEMLCYFLMILSLIVYGSVLAMPYAFLVFLWAMLSVPRPSKAFWITVITYTEIIVVIKYIFQFEFLPWNQGLPRTDPLWFPRILGIQQRENYANVDIVLLLALFIHRSILKRYGLWRDAYDLSKDVEKAECDDGKQPSIESAEDGHPSLETADVEVVVDTGDGGESGDKSPAKSPRRVGSVLDPFKNFYKQMTDPTFSATTDVYTLMLLCDIINFVILVFGYKSFGPAASTGGSVTSYLSDNRIPVPFLLMLLSQFFMIIIDRGLYLKKNVLGKFVWQIILVIGIHIIVFFILPRVTNISFIYNRPAQLFYFIKCIYFGLSAYQIRSGYPTRILGNFLTKKYNYLNLFLFQGFRAIPFILEIRALMDWMWTDTTMSMGGWLQMEDIYANIFILKCWRRAENAYPVQRGNRKRPLIKYIVGGLLLLIIIFIIWFPLVLFSFANAVYVANPPVECKISIAIGGYDPIFSINAQRDVISGLYQDEYDAFKRSFYNRSDYDRSQSINSFIGLFKPEDITLITIKGQSTEIWSISPPSLERLIENLKADASLRLEFSISFNRENTTSGVSETIGNMFYSNLASSAKKDLLAILDEKKRNESEPVTLDKLYPQFLRLQKSGKAEEIPLLSKERNGLEATLERGSIPGLTGSSEWWEIRDAKTEGKDFILYTFNDRVAPSGALSMIAGYGIVGLYISFILLIGKFLRGATSGLYANIMWKWLPFVDRVLQLTLDIYLVREMKEWRLEEDLYARLMFLYRSPETMIKYTYLPPSMIKAKVE